ncbi:hypothetical protein Bca52824_093372 [Brassica carinata]|uniref:Protein LATERAL ROOT PRIMORDIUM 1 n=1 Tax=Brassica carinata TaxID=52824 RepID=A0A8X7TLU1_BRACI|nr:hypothetical protein Bca52824_093372 [Brassica carinata]
MASRIFCPVRPPSAAATTTTSSRATEDLSLGFNAGPAGCLVSASAAAGVPSWPPGSSVRYGLPSAAATEMGMVGLRDVYLVAPAYHHHHQHVGLVSGSDQINSNAAAASLGVGVIPLLTTAPAQQHQNVGDTDINFLGNSRRWQSNDSSSNNQTEYLHFKSTTVASTSNNSGSGSAGTATCQDCGNQAKKECKQRRCRTCCKSRGFDCSTHVKSTWVSAARRRERQVMPTTSTSSGTKKPRIVGSQQQQQATSHTSTSNTPPQSFDTSSSQKDGGSREAWPGQVRAAAVFKCVRVTAVEDGDDEYAYQAVVKIGGHIFKGFLYDQGLEPKEGFPNMSDLHLGGEPVTTTSAPHQTNVASSSNNSGSGSAGTATCQDCGNQAKKECKQRRCRTCCKSRGFDCSTHVKSTWVSAARRREKQVMPTAGSSPSTSSGTKKPRIAGSQQQATSHTSTSNTPPQSFDTSSSRQDGGLREAWPGQVRAAAVFKCVKVTAMEDGDGDDEYAYQAVVKIGGHIFKGFLYDQGLEPKEGFPNMSDLHLGGGASNHNGVSASPPILDPPNVYGGGAGGGFYG